MPGPKRPLPITEPRKLAAALRRLDDRDRRVLELRYGLGGERQHLLAEVGRELGVSRERARQLEDRALRKLAAHGGAPAPRRGQAVETPAFMEGFVRPWTLLCLRRGPAHGYELRERLRERGLAGLDYRFLRRLEREGVVRSSWEQASAGPERRVYRLTAKGTRQLRVDAEAIGQVVAALTRFMGEYEELVAGRDRAARGAPSPPAISVPG